MNPSCFWRWVYITMCMSGFGAFLQQLVVFAHVMVTLDVTELHCTPVIQGHSLRAIGKGIREGIKQMRDGLIRQRAGGRKGSTR